MSEHRVSKPVQLLCLRSQSPKEVECRSRHARRLQNTGKDAYEKVGRQARIGHMQFYQTCSRASASRPARIQPK